MYFFGGRSTLLFWQKDNIISVAFIHIYKKYYIPMYFLRKIILNLSSKEKKYFREKIPSFQIIQERSYSRTIFGKTIFSEHLKKISYFYVFFWERSSFIFLLNNKTIFSGKINIIFPDNTKKIIFQCNFFGKTIFSEHVEKENMVFRAVIFPRVRNCRILIGLCKLVFNESLNFLTETNNA